MESLGTDGAGQARLSRFDRDRLTSIVGLVALEEPGEPIRVFLAGEESEAARTTPSWIAGYASGATGTVVLFPSRSLRYPHDSLEAVLHHEVAHVLIYRAARGQRVPRWFNEGLATVAERGWALEDRRQLAWALAVRSPPRMEEVDDLFQQGPGEATQAYAIASAFVRHLLDRYGREAAGRILSAVAHGLPFEEAFSRVTGERLASTEAAFLARFDVWDRWIPLVTSPYVLWMGVTLLAILAIWRRRQRSAALRRRWEDEEDARSSSDSDAL